MSGHLIALDKLPIICLVGVGETWHRFFAKCMLKFTGPEANHACKDDQLCAGFKPGIRRAVHEVWYIWVDNSTKENCDFLLVDAKNNFNEINIIIMLWKVLNLWTYGARFVLNWYCHHSLLMLRKGDGTTNIIHSREVVAQGYPLAIFAHVVWLINLIKRLKLEAWSP